MQVEDGLVDVAIVAPLGEQASSPKWLEDAAADASERLAAEGLVYVIAPVLARRALAARLSARGLEQARVYLHVVRFAELVYLVELERNSLAYAFASLVDGPGWKRKLAAKTLGSRASGLAWQTPLPVGVSFLHRGKTPAAWLLGADGSLAACLARDPPRRAVLFCSRPGGSNPRLVARPAAHPSSAADRVRADAGSAGARVPERAELAAGPEGVRIETGIAGVPAAIALADRPRRLPDVLGALSAWLTAWNRRTSRPARLTSERLSNEVLEPAAKLASLLPAGDAYATRLERLGAELIGAELPFVDVHDDLTMWNVLLAPNERIGVVDWDVARVEGLPSTDYWYALVDAFVATRRYSGRLGAFRHALELASQQQLALPFDLDPRLLELCFHSCWLRHAANDLERDDRAEPRRDFLAIARALAAGEPLADLAWAKRVR